MLDAYIIERIRKDGENNRSRGALIPLRIEQPRREPSPSSSPSVEDEEVEERGSVVIDFQL